MQCSHACMRACACVCVCVCVCVWGGGGGVGAHVCVSMHTCACACVRACVCVHTCFSGFKQQNSSTLIIKPLEVKVHGTSHLINR